MISKNIEKKRKSSILASQNYPKSVQNASKIDVSKNMRLFMDLCWFLVACCKSRTSNFMRPRNVLLAFHNHPVFAFGLRVWSKKPTKNFSKTRPEPFKNRCRKRVVFQHRFFQVSASISERLGLPTWSQVDLKPQIRQRLSPPRHEDAPLQERSLVDVFKKLRLGGFQARF